jgi:hypothetical protein
VDEPQRINPEGQIAWITEYADVDRQSVGAVLAVELEYMAIAGIAEASSGYEFRYYKPSDVDPSDMVDKLRIAVDAKRRAGVPEEIGYRVLEAELAFLRLRGID